MQYLFIDNFRGFKETFLPLKSVNFLVGENSTGKSSVMGLLQLVSTEAFWFTPLFNTDEVSFGHFHDIVSINAKNRTYFRIGMVFDVVSTRQSKRKTKPHRFTNAFLMTFVEKEGSPSLRDFSYIFSDKVVHARFSKEGVEYKFRSVDPTMEVDQFLRDVYPSMIVDHKKNTGSYRQVQGLPQRLDTSNTLLVRALIEEDMLERNKVNMRSTVTRRLLRHPGFRQGAGMVWLAPIRTRPRRTYDEYRLDYSPEGEHTPFLIKRILDSKSDAQRFRKFLRRIGTASGLFETLRIKKYGRSATSPFELDITLNRKALSIGNVGYGVSQALPVIVELFARPKNSRFAIQQPEVHLHPKAQAVLGDIMYELAQIENKKFIVETHSDYMIDRFRMNYRKTSAGTPDAQILFFERVSSGNRVHVIPIKEGGRLPENQPEGYRGFFVNESLRLLGI